MTDCAARDCALCEDGVLFDLIEQRDAAESEIPEPDHCDSADLLCPGCKGFLDATFDDETSDQAKILTLFCAPCEISVSLDELDEILADEQPE